MIVSGIFGFSLWKPVPGEGEPQVLACRDVWFDASVPVQHTCAGGRVTFTVTPELAGKNILIAFV